MNAKTIGNKGSICVAYWQRETIRCKDEEFSFSPFGIKNIAGWVLMRWCRTRGHVIDTWYMQISEKKSVPVVPRSVWRALKKQTKNAKMEPWPGNE